MIKNNKKKNILIVLTCLLLNACLGGNDINDHLDEYTSRLAKVTEQTVPQLSSDLRLHYPDNEFRRVALDETTLNLREFYAFNGCPLAPLIAQRNTALGKVEIPERRYIYERDLLAALAQCTTVIPETDSDVIEELTRLQTFKQAQLPLVWAQMIQNSHALVTGLGFSNRFLREAQVTEDVTASVAAVNYLAQLSAGKSRTTSMQELSEHFAVLENLTIPASAWRTQLLISQKLPVATQLIRNYSENLNCASARKDIAILRNVMTLFFIEKIQPIASNINHIQYRTADAWQTILTQPGITQAYKTFITNHTEDNFNTYQKHVLEHVAAWQRLFERCDQV